MIALSRARSGTFDFPSAAESLGSCAGARAAIAEGNYELAAKLGEQERNPEATAIAILMAGGVRRGLEQLLHTDVRSADSHLYAAFGHWCLEEPEAALRQLELIARSEFSAQAARLRSLIERATLSAVVLADANNARGAPVAPGRGFAVRHIATPSGRDAMLAEPDALTGVDLVLSYDSLNEPLLDAVRQARVPCAATSTDFDQRIDEFDEMLRQIDIILAATALEHHLLARIYDGRVVSYPALPLQSHRGPALPVGTTKDLDVFFSGMAFAPHWPDKARMLFRIAAIDNPELAIRIHQGYLDEADYRRTMQRAKFVPLFNRMGFSVNQDRVIEVLSYGTSGLSFEGVEGKYLLGPAGRRFVPIADERLEADVLRHIARYRPENESSPGIRTILDDFYPPRPERDSRTLKFVLFQTLFMKPRPDTVGARAARNPARGAGREIAARFSQFARQPGLPAEDALHAALNGDIAVRPAALMPRFNKARVLWMTGKRDVAVPLFEEVVRLAEGDGHLAPGDGALSHLVRALAELMPYHAYYRGLVRDLADGSDDYPRARAVVAATSRVYLSLQDSIDGRYERAVALARQALSLCDEHFPAARQLAKALYAAGAPPVLLFEAFDRAVALYPPYINELLPIGIQALERLGHHELALSFVRMWAYFRTRVTYQHAAAPAIPQSTLDCALAYYPRLPDRLRLALKLL